MLKLNETVDKMLHCDQGRLHVFLLRWDELRGTWRVRCADCFDQGLGEWSDLRIYEPVGE